VNIVDNPVMEDKFILITPTTGFGQIPIEVDRFLQKNSELMIAVASSGNRNWGLSYGKSGEVISRLFKVPLLMKFENSGFSNDINTFIERVHEVVEMDRAE
jgi:protein involved in ribonucleotide reduction